MFCREQHEVKLFFSRFRQLLLKDLLTGLEDKLFEKLVSVLTSPTYRESKTWPTILAVVHQALPRTIFYFKTRTVLDVIFYTNHSSVLNTPG